MVHRARGASLAPGGPHLCVTTQMWVELGRGLCYVVARAGAQPGPGGWEIVMPQNQALPGAGPTTTGLTTGRAPFVEEARQRGQLYIEQRYELYSEENHESWTRLFARMQPRWRQYANPHFLNGIQALHLPPDRVPRLSEVNRALEPLTGFQAKAVSGYVPSFLFFDCLRRREFPTTITIRPFDKLDYLPEPDIFHDVAGHVPMHTDPAFAETLVRFGDCAHTAVEMMAGVADEREKIRRLTSILRALSRFFWFTVEFGLMRGPRGVCAYGSGLLSSHGELRHAVESDEVQRYPKATCAASWRRRSFGDRLHNPQTPELRGTGGRRYFFMWRQQGLYPPKATCVWLNGTARGSPIRRRGCGLSGRRGRPTFRGCPGGRTRCGATRPRSGFAGCPWAAQAPWPFSCCSAWSGQRPPAMPPSRPRLRSGL